MGRCLSRKPQRDTGVLYPPWRLGGAGDCACFCLAHTLLTMLCLFLQSRAVQRPLDFFRNEKKYRKKESMAPGSSLQGPRTF